jgi:hypothetical protein
VDIQIGKEAEKQIDRWEERQGGKADSITGRYADWKTAIGRQL